MLIGARSRSVAENHRSFFAQEVDVIRGLRLPVVFCNLNGSRKVDALRLPLALSDASSISVSFDARIVKHALDDFGRGGYPKARAFLYPPEVYAELRL
jgi:hypothetical protein